MLLHRELNFIQMVDKAHLALAKGQNVTQFVREHADPRRHTIKYIDRLIESYELATVLFTDGQHRLGGAA